jgi:hypothetical protein
MADLASLRTHRGTNVRGALYDEGGQVQNVFVASEIDVTFETDDLATDPLSAQFTSHEEFPNDVMVMVKGIKKTNAFLKMYATEFLAAAKAGRSLKKFSFIVTYRDVNTNTDFKLTIVNGALKPEAFNSGGRKDQQGEGFTLRGNLQSAA